MAAEAIQFEVMERKVKTKRDGITYAQVTLESANAKGTSKIIIVGEETLLNEYRNHEFYELTLTQVKAPE